ncbi:MAG TPA: hypothetical protein VIF63_09210 [Candidatus Limnocylindrales bacterium]|jgi:hypothetical protein
MMNIVAPDATPIWSANPWRRYGIEEPPGRRLRLGLLVDDPERLPSWAASSVRLLCDSGLADLVVIATAAGVTSDHARRPGNLGYRLARATIWRTPSDALESTKELGTGARRIRLAVEAGVGNRRRLSPAALQDLRDAQLDLVLRVGADDLDDPGGESATHGTWSFELGSGSRSGGPVGFWEMAGRASEMEIRLVRSSGAGRGTDVLVRGSLAVDPHSYGRTVDRALRACVDLPLQICRDILCGRAPIAGSAMPSAVSSGEPATMADSRGTPGWRAVGRVVASTVLASLARGIYGAFVLKQWSVGRLDGGAARLLSGDVAAARWVDPGGRTRMLADPAIVPGTSGNAVLCETLDHADGRGRIVRLELSQTSDRGRGGLSVRQEILLDVEGLHLSYPSLATIDDRLLLVPEASGSGGLLLADLAAGATTVADVRHAAGLAAVDPTLFRHAGQWWLTCTELGPTSGSHLWLFHGPDPRGPWTAHSRNPVVIDAGAARGAGTPFSHEGQLYRPAQDLRAGYGRSVRLMRVLALTHDEYAEELAIELSPDPRSPFPRGLHTVSVDGDAIWVDGYRTVIHPLAGWFRLRARPGAAAAAPGRLVGGWPA